MEGHACRERPAYGPKLLRQTRRAVPGSIERTIVSINGAPIALGHGDVDRRGATLPGGSPPPGALCNVRKLPAPERCSFAENCAIGEKITKGK